MKQIVFYLVRHGQTELNLAGVVQSTSDSPLTESGIRDAERAAQALKNVLIRKAYSSPYLRAYRTAEIILQEHPSVSLHVHEGLREFDFGALDGRYIADLQDEFAARSKSGDFTDIGGESRELMRERIRRTFAEIADTCEDGDHVLIASHGEFCRQMIPGLFGIDDTEMRKQETSDFVPNGSITRFAYTDGVWQLLALPVIPEKFEP